MADDPLVAAGKEVIALAKKVDDTVFKVVRGSLFSDDAVMGALAVYDSAMARYGDAPPVVDAELLGGDNVYTRAVAHLILSMRSDEEAEAPLDEYVLAEVLDDDTVGISMPGKVYQPLHVYSLMVGLIAKATLATDLSDANSPAFFSVFGEVPELEQSDEAIEEGGMAKAREAWHVDARVDEAVDGDMLRAYVTRTLDDTETGTLSEAQRKALKDEAVWWYQHSDTMPVPVGDTVNAVVETVAGKTKVGMEAFLGVVANGGDSARFTMDSVVRKYFAALGDHSLGEKLGDRKKLAAAGVIKQMSVAFPADGFFVGHNADGMQLFGDTARFESYMKTDSLVLKLRYQRGDSFPLHTLLDMVRFFVASYGVAGGEPDAEAEEDAAVVDAAVSMSAGAWPAVRGGAGKTARVLLSAGSALVPEVGLAGRGVMAAGRGAGRGAVAAGRLAGRGAVAAGKWLTRPGTPSSAAATDAFFGGNPYDDDSDDEDEEEMEPVGIPPLIDVPTVDSATVDMLAYWDKRDPDSGVSAGDTFFGGTPYDDDSDDYGDGYEAYEPAEEDRGPWDWQG
jgi:hypothetical protein